MAPPVMDPYVRFGFSGSFLLVSHRDLAKPWVQEGKGKARVVRVGIAGMGGKRQRQRHSAAVVRRT